jgi:protein SDA1
VGCNPHERTLEEGCMVRASLFYILSFSLYLNRKDAKSVSIISQGCFHPVIKVQSASIYFFLGDDEESEDSDQEDVSSSQLHANYLRTIIQDVDVRGLHHRREINKKTRSGEKKLRKQLKTAKKVRRPHLPLNYNADFVAKEKI